MEATVDEILSFGKKAAVSIKPRTEIDSILSVLPKVYMVLIMTVEPGYGGQKIRKDTFEKIRKLKSYIAEKGYEIDIEVDGGVDLENLPEVLDAGANVIVAGTKIFRGNVKDNVQAFREVMDTYERAE